MTTATIVLTTATLAALCCSAIASPQVVSVTHVVTPDSNGKSIRAFSFSVVKKPARQVFNELFAAAGEKSTLSNHVHGNVTVTIDKMSFAGTVMTLLRANKNRDIWTDDDLATLYKVEGKAMTKDGVLVGFASPNPMDTWAVAVNHGSARKMMVELKQGKAGSQFDEPIQASTDDKSIVYHGDQQKHVILRSMVATLDK